MSGVSRGIDRIEAMFDDPGLVANAGLVAWNDVQYLGAEFLVTVLA